MDDMAASEVLVALSTAPDEATARRLARQLVEESLAACVNLLGSAQSIYRWQGQVEEAAEWMMWIKTTREAWPRLKERLSQWHPYEVPELLALQVQDGHAPYLAWVLANVKGADR
ncbi:MAG: divalent-cation tolerance protein CutA [Caldimonas sp.]|uniref:divalent-cation tolerance protein CutA n=1 Tax=Caldimonas taiwanensis TaxID=307483 RepID=UPI000A049818|nr:divalent-cation tolerance protein CutA [Caldimonas taiwanensis]GIX24074.1 MAG: divalent-cation tolerance protein CutA [Caldimonas sp.]